MKIELISQAEDILLNRKEIRFRVLHEGEGTPRREEVLKALKETLYLGKKIPVLISLQSEFGKDSSKGWVRVYPTIEDAKSIEPLYLLKRSGLIKEEKK